MLGATILRIHRPQVENKDAYDAHKALVTVDGAEVGTVELGDTIDFDLTPGQHEIGVRLRFNFGTAHVSIDAQDGSTTTVTCSKAHAARNQALHPSHYWQLTVEG